MLFKLLVCVLLVALKGKAQAWCLAVAYLFWMNFVCLGQPHIAHRKVYSEFLSVFANFVALIVPLLALYGVIPTAHLTFLMMFVNMATVAMQIVVEFAVALQALLYIPGVQNCLPASLRRQLS